MKRYLKSFIAVGAVLILVMTVWLAGYARQYSPKQESPMRSGGAKTAEAAGVAVSAAADSVGEAEPGTLAYLHTLVSPGQQIRSLQFLASLGVLARSLREDGFIYSNHGVRSTHARALTASTRKSNCALYVSWAMQMVGTLPEGETIWLDTKIHGSGTDTVKHSDKLAVCYPGIRTADCGLVPGDIVGWYNDQNGSFHTAVYAGMNENGDYLWFTAGPRDFKAKDFGPKVVKAYEERPLRVLIRMV
ncbi:MAG: hypothetical protein IJH77_01680 [Mogibacterium sp.]|nr:hypothetical protein [Mogibacterium sp.]